MKKKSLLGPSGAKMASIFIRSSIHCQNGPPKLEISMEPKNHDYNSIKMVVQANGIRFHN